MNVSFKKRLLTLLCSSLFVLPCFSQQSFTAWITEIEIDANKVQILRVPEEEIKMPRAKYDVLSLQKQLEKCLQNYRAGKPTQITSTSFDFDFLRVNVPEWPISYYEQELKAYRAFNVAWAKRDHDSLIAAVNKRQDDLRMAEQVRGYSFINKPFVLLKEKPSVTSMTMAKIYRGSYVRYLGKVENTNYIGIDAGSLTGYIQVGDLVDSLDKLDAPADEMAVLRARYYYKIEESAAYTAKIEKLAAAEMAAEAKARPAGTRTGRTYHAGPKNGCYYINSKGNKVYVDHSYCR